MQVEQWASEDRLAAALEEIVQKCDEFDVDLLLIGAFAVRAYAERRRLTTDLDFVAPRMAQGTLAAMFKSLGYEYSPHTRFGGVQAIRYVGQAKVQVDVAVDAIYDQSTGNAYSIPSESFRQKARVKIVPVEGGRGVEAYALPLVDLLVSKLIPSRRQDMADALALILAQFSPDIVAGFARRVRDSGLSGQISNRLSEMMNLPDRTLQDLMSSYIGGRLTGQEISTFRRRIREIHRHMRGLQT